MYIGFRVEGLGSKEPNNGVLGLKYYNLRFYRVQAVFVRISDGE